MTYVLDGSRIRAMTSGYEPPIRDGFMWWEGQLREVFDIHVTRMGTQIELYPLRAY